jgi:hypothetical protein
VTIVPQVAAAVAAHSMGFPPGASVNDLGTGPHRVRQSRGQGTGGAIGPLARGSGGMLHGHA